METKIGLIVFAVIQAFIIAQYNKSAIEKKQAQWHRFQWLSWVLFYSAISYSFYQPTNTKEFIPAVLLVLLLGLIHWNVFDPLLNIFRKLPIFHRGKNFLDKYVGHPLVKLVLLIVITLIYFIYENN